MSDKLIQKELQASGWSCRPASQVVLPTVRGEEEFLASWADLVQDQHMADGGSYRYRRYSRLLWSDGELQSLAGNSIYQELIDNPLNGGVLRTFAPLLPEVLDNPFLQGVIKQDAQAIGLRGNWQVGIHCVRILARPDSPGHSAPEGIHRDAEAYTVQHLIARHRVRGGVFSGYNEEKKPVFHWLQLQRWDSLYFTGTLWHSATPVESLEGGYRDILLIDFQPLEQPGG